MYVKLDLIFILFLKIFRNKILLQIISVVKF
jgi:hypothetical protein